MNNPHDLRADRWRGSKAATAEAGTQRRRLALTMIIADETDEAAMAKWEHYKAGTDLDALAWSRAQAAADKKAARQFHRRPHRRAATAAADQRLAPDRLLRHGGAPARRDAGDRRLWPACMLTFDDFVIGVEQFGQRIQPLMRSRAEPRPGGLTLDALAHPYEEADGDGRSSISSCAASASATATSPPSTASRSRSGRASSSACSGPPAAARPRPCAASPGWRSRTTARS